MEPDSFYQYVTVQIRRCSTEHMEYLNDAAKPGQASGR